MTDPQVHRTVVGGSTLELRRPLDLGDRLVLIVDATVNSVGVRRVSDGDIEVRNLKVLDILEVNADDASVTKLLEDARAVRKTETDERLGRMALPLDGEDHFLISFGCGHDAHYPEDWREREEEADQASDDETLSYWQAQDRPVEGGSAPCPICYRGAGVELGAVSEVVTVGLEGTGVEPIVAHDVSTEEGLDAWVEELIPGYVDHDPEELLGELDNLGHRYVGVWESLARFEVLVAERYPEAEGRDEVLDYLASKIAAAVETAPWDGYDGDAAHVVKAKIRPDNARHVELYEGEHKKRKGILAAALEARGVTDEETF